MLLWHQHCTRWRTPVCWWKLCSAVVLMWQAVVKALVAKERYACGDIWDSTSSVVWLWDWCTHTAMVRSPRNLICTRVTCGVIAVWQVLQYCLCGKEYCCTSLVCMWWHLWHWLCDRFTAFGCAVNRLWAGWARGCYGVAGLKVPQKKGLNPD